jgi:TATA-box binding protein (TBP) (component of TFIID and TFIIIB)
MLNIETMSDEKIKNMIIKLKNKNSGKKVSIPINNEEGGDNEIEFGEMECKIMDFMERFHQMKKNSQLTPTPIRISTRSAIGRLSRPIKLQEFIQHVIQYFQNVEENAGNAGNTRNADIQKLNIIGMKWNQVIYGNIKKVQKKTTKKTKQKKNFYNQTTFLVQTSQNQRPVNIKIFSNGSISMTGCKEEFDGLYATRGLVADMKKYADIFYNAEDCESLDVIDYGITLINSDFSIGHKIDRTELYKLVVDDYGLFATYEPTIYPGVKVTYMWNNLDDIQRNTGLCKCSTNCLLKNRKKERNNGICKKITIAVFQSGKIIITGSNTLEQTNDAYEFINNILQENSSRLVRFSVNDLNNMNAVEDVEEKGEEGEEEK